jgi:hypothetical protein
MLAQLCGDRVGHDLAAVDLRRLAPVYHDVPSGFGIGVNCHLEVAGADPLLHDFFEFGGVLLLLVHAVSSELPASVHWQLRTQSRLAGRGYAIGSG